MSDSNAPESQAVTADTAWEVNENIIEHEQSDSESNLNFEEVESLTSELSDEEAMAEAKELVKEEKEATETPVATKEDKQLTDQELDDQEARQDDLEAEAEAELIEDLKLLKAKRGETEYDIPEDAVIMAKVDGQDVEISLNELKQNYSGKVAWDKRFQQLDTERKDFLEDKTLVEQYVNNFRELALVNKDYQGALAYLGELAGMDPLEFKKDLRNQLLENYQEYMSMDETQRALHDQKEENEFLKSRQESDSQKRQAEQSQVELQTRVKEAQEAHNINDQEFLDYYKALEENYEGEVTVDTVVEYAQRVRSYEKTEDLLGQINEDLLQNDELVEAVSDIVIENSDFSDEDLLEIVQEALDLKPKRQSKKVAKAKQEAAPKEPTKKSAKSEVDTFFFEDLED